MSTTVNTQDLSPYAGRCRTVTMLLWLAIATGWFVAIFSVIEEMCMVSACRDTAGFTIFGLNMGWFGIGYFSLLLLVLWLRKRDRRLDRLLPVLVFSGIGAEFRLLWIQKFIIGGWCPLCITICSALFVAAILLVIEKVREVRSGGCGVKGLWGWLAQLPAAAVTGLVIALLGVKALY